MEIFISHKQEDEFSARRIAAVCRNAGVGYYLDVLDDFTFEDAESLTNHIHEKLNDCTDLMVVMSFKTKYSQWVPFEIGMAAQAYMPTASYLSDDVRLPEFLEFWPQLKSPEDVIKYINTKRKIFGDSVDVRGAVTESWEIPSRMNKLSKFYMELKQSLR